MLLLVSLSNKKEYTEERLLNASRSDSVGSLHVVAYLEWFRSLSHEPLHYFRF